MTKVEEFRLQLSDSPFDLELRVKYAVALTSAGELTEAVKQWRLVESQDHSARGLLHAALCLERLGRQQDAREEVKKARARDDYEAELARLEPEQRAQLELPVNVAALQLVAGGAPPREGRVVSIHRADKIRFSDVAGMEALKKTLRLRIIEPFLRPSLFEKFRRKAGGGVLLYGPPGCGKTMMAKAIATECQASFTAIGISDVLNMWIGESEKNLAQIFEKARSERPAVLFFDELDALAFSRSKAQSDHTRSMVNEFLNQLDGMNRDNSGVLILGATNLPWDVDSAMKRPGRFDRLVFVPPPDASARAAMFEMKLRDVPKSDLDLVELARVSEGFSGADIDGVIEGAKDGALMRELEGEQGTRLTQADLTVAVEEAEPSTEDWLKTARNLVKFGGGGRAYKDVEAYLRQARLY